MRIKLNTEQFIELANLTHNYKYDYSKSIYNGSKEKVTITCKIHGDFLQRPEVHLLNKSGCAKCWYNRSDPLIENFKKESYNVFGNKFDLLNIKIRKNIFYNIKCPKHGNFSSSLEDHLSDKNGNCFKCKFKPKIIRNKIIKNKPNYNWHSTEINIFDDKTKVFVEKAIKIHNNKYNYLKSKYIHCIKEKIVIICPKHGEFLQTANDHLSGKGCNKCSKIVSKQETAWLNSFNILKENRNVKIKLNSEYFIVDGFDPDTNTVYEFNGDFWHGNPKKYNPKDINKVSKKTFGELYELTIQKENKLKQHGYNVVSIFESDFKNQLWVKKELNLHLAD